MSDKTVISLPLAWLQLQPPDVRSLAESERDALIVKAVQVNGQWLILSRYGDDIWLLDGFTSNTPESEKYLDFSRVPPPFRSVMKAIFYRYLRRGRRGQKRPSGSTILHYFKHALPFLRYLEIHKLKALCSVTPMVCATYVATCRERQIKARGNMSKPISSSYLMKRLAAVEALHELSQYTQDPIQQHPWAETSAAEIAGRTGSNAFSKQDCKTPLIPDEVFCTLFEKAYQEVQRGKFLLDLRDTLASANAGWEGRPAGTVLHAKNRHLVVHGWKGGLGLFKEELANLRNACYVVLASTSGCRNHELANLQSGAHHRTEDDEGTIYHWMRSRSEKTDVGDHDWMIPIAAVRALRVMERWAEPYQAMIADELAKLRKNNPCDPEIAKVQQHRYTLFLGVDKKRGNQVRTLSHRRWVAALTSFAQRCGVEWVLASHQFRRKFANYVAHSQFGDLRYLREHYAHWSMDMTLTYAMDQAWGQHLDIELFDDIQSEFENIKRDVVDSWLDDESLAGGYGRDIKSWQRDPKGLAIFQSHAAMVASIAESTAIRSNGHAWCTADNSGCVGNNLERTRCSGCCHSVIGHVHTGFYQGLYDNLTGLLDCQDIGDGGRARVKRDLERCRNVFAQLGYAPETNS